MIRPACTSALLDSKVPGKGCGCSSIPSCGSHFVSGRRVHALTTSISTFTSPLVPDLSCALYVTGLLTLARHYAEDTNGSRPMCCTSSVGYSPRQPENEHDRGLIQIILQTSDLRGGHILYAGTRSLFNRSAFSPLMSPFISHYDSAQSSRIMIQQDPKNKRRRPCEDTDIQEMTIYMPSVGQGTRDFESAIWPRIQADARVKCMAACLKRICDDGTRDICISRGAVVNRHSISYLGAVSRNKFGPGGRYSDQEFDDAGLSGYGVMTRYGYRARCDCECIPGRLPT